MKIGQGEAAGGAFLANEKGLEQRVLVLAPTSKDAELTRSVLDTAGIESFGCRDLNEMCDQLEAGAAAILLPEDAVIHDADHRIIIST